MRFDHVVVGAGSAGAVVAARLSEDPDRRVLLLEAGADQASTASAGWDFYAALEQPGRTWPELRVRRHRDGPVDRYEQGRGLGGSSAVNAMVAQLPPPEDLDRWERELGGDGWGWATMGAYLQRAAQSCTLAKPEWLGDVDRALLAAQPDAARPAMLQWREGRRWSTDLVLKGQRMTVRGNALVDLVVLDGRAAVGVQLVNGEQIEAGEVIVCAGALHTPAILLRSGIDRPDLGRNLRDHPAAGLTLVRRHPASTNGPVIAATAQWSHDLHVTPVNRTDDPHAAKLMVALMAVRSSGTVRLASNNATSEPVVDFHLLDDELDRTRLRDGVQRLVEVTHHAAFSEVAIPIEVDAEGTPATALLDDDVLDAWLPGALGGYYHAAGTCRMGPPADDGAVVDTHCRVIGVDGLRVADASILPELPRANPHLLCVAIGERVAELVAADQVTR